MAQRSFLLPAGLAVAVGVACVVVIRNRQIQISVEPIEPELEYSLKPKSPFWKTFQASTPVPRDPTLCDACNDVDLQYLLRVENRESSAIWDMQHVQRHHEQCRFCRILERIRSHDHQLRQQTGEFAQYESITRIDGELKISSSKGEFGDWKRAIDIRYKIKRQSNLDRQVEFLSFPSEYRIEPFLRGQRIWHRTAVAEGDCCQSSDLGCSVYLRGALTKLHDCDENHWSTCRVFDRWERSLGGHGDPVEPEKLMALRKALHLRKPAKERSLPYFRLIDVENSSIVLATLERSIPPRYVALSYPWGDEKQGQLTRDKVDDAEKDGGLSCVGPLPQTILDAIEVTKMLGIQYLWVDRLCIVQDDIWLQSQAIERMHAIYQFAYCTIVAAHGTDADAGLPGVSSKWPADDPELVVTPEPETLSEFKISIPELSIGDLTNYDGVDELRDVANSGWIHRGWTFQEKMCSPRSLMFTETGMVLWCCKRIERRSIWGWRGISNNPLEPHLRSFSGNAGYSPQTFEGFLKAYHGRELTHETDRLNAISGLLELVFPQDHCIDDPRAKSSVHGMPYSMPGFGLAWRSDSVISRSALQKPTWSWVGYDFRGKPINFDIPKGNSILSIWGIRALTKILPIGTRTLRATLYNRLDRPVRCPNPSWDQHFKVDRQQLDKAMKFLWNLDPKKYLPKAHLQTQVRKLKDKIVFRNRSTITHDILAEQARYKDLSEDELWNEPKFFDTIYTRLYTAIQQRMETYFVLFFTSVASFTLRKSSASLEWDDIHQWDIYTNDDVRVSSIVLPDSMITGDQLDEEVMESEFIVVEGVTHGDCFQYGIMMVSRDGAIYSRVQMAKEYVDAEKWHALRPEKRLIILG